MAMLPGQRYGEPRWGVRMGYAAGSRPEDHPALSTTVSYEERRLKAYHAQYRERPEFAKPDL